ncbi:MAG: DNA translocase FtsK, partial [Erysipelotrichaceae bacterium]|nr:DNA translocase FtsK [Erysipelotrichaceae bacterium]
KIMNSSDNIKMELAAKDIRIEAPIPGRSAVGIEIPNVEPVPVRMLDLIRNVPQEKRKLSLLFCLGKDLMGKPVYCDLAKMPHLLIAGATGSGKSVCINSIITSFLLRTNPDDVKLVLVDPKKVEFTPYKDIPHLLWPIIDDPVMASNMLKKVVVIMEERYDAFATVGVRNIDGFNSYVSEYNDNLQSGEEPMNRMPYMVVIIDELADLMAIAGKDVELSIQRITQLARASGIHLIVATQRPSTDVITGLIKSNIPSRISFAVASSIDSRTILDQTGAERLLGNGDMLYYPQGETAPIRMQGVYVTDKEINKITSYVKSQAKPDYEDSYYEFLTNMNGTTVMSANSVNADSMDSLYDDVVEFVRGQQKASTSLLQRRFGIGYNRAARLIDTLEDRGIIGPANGSKPREVYLKEEDDINE